MKFLLKIFGRSPKIYYICVVEKPEFIDEKSIAEMQQ